MGPVAGGGTPPPPVAPEGVFGPTGRPDQPITAGSGFQDPSHPETPPPDLVLRQLVRDYPSPYLMKLLEMEG